MMPCGSKSGSSRVHAAHHERIDRDRAAVDDHEWVDVDGPHVGLVRGEVRQREQDPAHRVAVDRRLAPHRAEERLGAQLVEHVGGVEAGQRRQSERDVGPCLGEDAADTDHHATARTARRCALRR